MQHVQLLEAAVNCANKSAGFEQKASHLLATTIMIESGDQAVTLDFHRGKVRVIRNRLIEGCDLSIRGPVEEWSRLLHGDVPYSQAINPVHGLLRLDGNLVVAAWANQALSELFRISAKVKQGAGTVHG